MYNNFNIELERNKMLTSPTIGLTSSIVNNKLNDMLLEINSKINYINEVLGLKANEIDVNSEISLLNQNIDLKANTADVYNKTECDSRYIAIGSISKNIEVYPTINLLNLLDSLVSTQTSFTQYISKSLFMVNIPAESNVSLSTDSGMTLWHLKFVLYISSTGSDAEQLKDLMGIRLSAYIDNVYHEFSLSIQYLTSYARLYMDSTFITNSLPTEDKSLSIYVTSPTSISNLKIEFRNYSNIHNYIYRIGLST